jgi:hypothetical protein
VAQLERAALKRQSSVHGMRYLNPTAERRGAGKPETFDFLGFTHICGQSRQNGKFLVLRKTQDRGIGPQVPSVQVNEPLLDTYTWAAACAIGVAQSLNSLKAECIE